MLDNNNPDVLLSTYTVLLPKWTRKEKYMSGRKFSKWCHLQKSPKIDLFGTTFRSISLQIYFEMIYDRFVEQMEPLCCVMKTISNSNHRLQQLIESIPNRTAAMFALGFDVCWMGHMNWSSVCSLGILRFILLAAVLLGCDLPRSCNWSNRCINQRNGALIAVDNCPVCTHQFVSLDSASGC